MRRQASTTSLDDVMLLHALRIASKSKRIKIYFSVRGRWQAMRPTHLIDPIYHSIIFHDGCALPPTTLHCSAEQTTTVGAPTLFPTQILSARRQLSAPSLTGSGRRLHVLLSAPKSRLAPGSPPTYRPTATANSSKPSSSPHVPSFSVMDISSDLLPHKSEQYSVFCFGHFPCPGLR